MQFSSAFRIATAIAALGLSAQGQNPPAKEAPPEIRGLPPRATPGDYQSHAQAGAVTIAAEFTGHSISTVEGTLNTEDFVVVETGLFGPPGTHVQLTPDDFTLRVNGKKNVLPTQPYGMVIGNVKDPEWEPPESASKKSKTSLNSGGDQQSEGPPPPVHVPIELQRAMAQRVRKAALPEGDRTVPVAGLIFFRYRGKVKNIDSLELLYAGSAGKATLRLQP